MKAAVVVILSLILCLCLVKLNILQITTVKIRHVPEYYFLASQQQITTVFSLFANKFASKIQKISNKAEALSSYLIQPGNNLVNDINLTELCQISPNVLDAFKNEGYQFFSLENGNYLTTEFNSGILNVVYIMLSCYSIKKFTGGQIKDFLIVRQGKRITIVANSRRNEKLD